MASPAEAQSWSSQAALNALLRYAPQKQGLAELKRAAEDQFRGSVGAGESEGIMGQQAARGAVAPTQQIFANARQSGEQGRNLVAPILAALSSNSPFKAAAANEQAAGGERLGQSESHALSDLQQRSVAAAELPAYTRSAATQTLMKELQKLTSKSSMLQGQEGADVQSEIGKQRMEANKLAQSERANQRTGEGAERRSERSAATALDVTHRTSRENTEENNRTRREIAEGKLAPKEELPLKEQLEGKNTFSEIHSLAQHLHAEGQTRAQIIERLQRATPSVSGEEEGHKFTTKGTPGYEPGHLMSAALDVAEYGYVNQHHINLLKEDGYNPRHFGFLTESQFKSQHPQPSQGQREASQLHGLGVALGKVGH
jgi:hypothetical protein